MNWKALALSVVGGFVIGVLVSTAVNISGQVVAPRLIEDTNIGGLAMLIGWIWGGRWMYKTRLVDSESTPNGVVEPGQQSLFQRRKIAFVALLIITGACIGVGTIARLAQPNESEPPSDEAADRMQDIMVSVMRDPDSLTPEVRGEFWEIVESEGISREDMQEMRSFVTGFGIDYQRLFYQDALTSYRTGSPFESPDRLKMEEEMGDALGSQFRENRDMLEKIAAHEPVIDDGGAMYQFDEPSIQEVLRSLDRTERQLDKLMTRPGQQ